VTAKDFRTYHASRLMAEELAKAPPVHDESAVDRTVKEVLKRVAEHLGHTPAICRKNYVDPTVVEAYRKGIKARRAQRDLAL
jgi:DNA topoisomerase-1